MFKISNFTDNDDVTVLKEFGAFKTIEWKRDLSVNEASAMNAYFASEMNVRRRQVICDLSQAPVTVQAGAMQWMVGNVTCTTGVKGVGDLFGKAPARCGYQRIGNQARIPGHGSSGARAHLPLHHPARRQEPDQPSGRGRHDGVAHEKRRQGQRD